MSQTVDRRRNLAGENIVRQIETVQAGERGNRHRELTGEAVVREVEKL